MNIAIIGRPNVGKSTLFNKLVGSKSAIAGDMPGITRDRKIATADLFGLKFSVLDTPGVDTFAKTELAKSMNEQSFSAINESEVVLFVIDAREGITNYDREIADWLRSTFKKIGNRPVILLKNKSESRTAADNSSCLGFGDGIAVSAEHTLGFQELYEKILRIIPENTEISEEKNENHIKIAIVGRPNVGKSTLINAIIGENRLLTGDIAGITRDSIPLEWQFKNHKITLIDTAGQRRASKVEENVESIAVADAWKYIRQSNVVIVLMDVQHPFEKQDITIARKVFDEGKIIIFALNKSDTIENFEKVQEEMQKRAAREFSQVPDAPCILISALEKKGLFKIFNIALKLYENWNSRVQTSQLNRWFREAIAVNPPPLVNGLPIKLKYISQTNTKPPTFALFANRSEHLPKSYERYLLNSLRKFLNFSGIPLRLFIRQRENPFD